MKRLVAITIIAGVIGPAAAPAMASPGACSSQRTAVKADRAKLKADNATLKADRAQCTALTAEQLSYGHSGGRVENTTPCIDGATSGQSTWTFLTLTDQTITMVDNDALVRHT